MSQNQYNDYRILKTIEKTPHLTQRLIAKHTGINLSSINYALKQLSHNGFVKITNMNKKRILYHLTPSGMSQKGKLAFKYFLRNYNLFSDIQKEISLFLNKPYLKNKRLAIYGLNKITEIIFLCMKDNGIYFAGIYENDQGIIGRKWLGIEIRSIDLLNHEEDVDYIFDIRSAASDLNDLKVIKPNDLIKKIKQNDIKNPSVNSLNPGSGTTGVSINLIGAANTVTGSCTLLKAGGKKILIDCGLFNGNSFPFRAKDIDYIFLTHAHIDHSGRIPLLIDQGFKGEILCHHATTDIFPLLLEDGFKFDYSVKYKFSKDLLIEKIIEQSWGFEYNRWNKISKGLSFRLLDAGHILGSATIQFDANGEYIVFSGDIGNKNTGIIKDPVAPDYADIVIMESTYGGREHNKLDKSVYFKKIIKSALKDKGKVLIPSFALGRTQEIIYQLNDMVEKNMISDIPVFIDTPLGIEITSIYKKHSECFDDESTKRLEDKDDPLDFNKLFNVKHYKDSIKVSELAGPSIIIAGSGMCTGGRIVNHLENLLEKETTDLIFVGYQAVGTLGAEILKYSKSKDAYVYINGEKNYVRSQIHQISGFSAHADHEGLINWLDSIENKPHTLYLNHGELDAQRKLKNSLIEKFSKISVICAG